MLYVALFVVFSTAAANNNVNDDEHSSMSFNTEVWSWGVNTHGQLGHGDFVKRSVPYISL